MKFFKGLVVVILLAVVVIGAYFALRPEPDYSSTQAHSGWIISHKTAGLEYPENTVEGFEASLAMPVDAIELDVHLVKDGQFVLHHDPVLLDYNCFEKGNDTRLIIAQMTVAELEAMACVNHKVRAETNESIPYEIVTLDRFLQIYSETDQSKKLLLEIKVLDDQIRHKDFHQGLDVSSFHYDHDLVAAEMYALLRQYPEVQNIQFNTFSRELLLKLRELKNAEEQFDFGLLYKGDYSPEILGGPLDLIGVGCSNICWIPDYEEVRGWLDEHQIKTFIPHFVQATTWPFSSEFEENIMANKGDLRVITWTLNEPKDWSAYEKQNFDGILTDRPTKFREWAGE